MRTQEIRSATCSYGRPTSAVFHRWKTHCRNGSSIVEKILLIAILCIRHNPNVSNCNRVVHSDGSSCWRSGCFSIGCTVSHKAAQLVDGQTDRQQWIDRYVTLMVDLWNGNFFETTISDHQQCTLSPGHINADIYLLLIAKLWLVYGFFFRPGSIQSRCQIQCIRDFAEFLRPSRIVFSSMYVFCCVLAI